MHLHLTITKGDLMKTYLKHLGKIFFSSSLLLAAVAFSGSVHKEAVRTDAATTASIDFTSQGYSNEQEITSATLDANVSVAFAVGTNTGSSGNPASTPKYYTSGTSVRVYWGNTFTVSLSDTNQKLTSISFTFGTSDKSNEITPDSGTFTSPTWSGSAQSVIFTIGGTSGHRRIASISATYKNSTEHAVSITGSSMVEVGKTTQLTASCSEGETITWSITPESVATIDSSTGLVSGVTVGSATVTATCASGGSNTHTIKVIEPAPEVIKGKTIAEVTDLGADNTKLYEITGYVSTWYGTNTDGTKYGNFYLKDTSVSSGNGLYIYGASATEGSLSWDGTKFLFSNPQDFLTNGTTKNVAKGTRVSMYGFRLDFGATKEFNGVVTSIVSNEGQALEFARYFLDQTDTICADTARNNKTALEAIWPNLTNQFNTLSPEAREVVKTYDTATGGEEDATNACKRYDHIITRYALVDFIGRNPSSSSRSPVLLYSDNNNYMIVAVAIVLFASVTLIGAYLVSKKRKYN